MTMADPTLPVRPAPGARAFVLLKSRRRLDLLNPDPAAWTDEDLAGGLSSTMRWAERRNDCVSAAPRLEPSRHVKSLGIELRPLPGSCAMRAVVAVSH
jgi:hypothetical protein